MTIIGVCLNCNKEIDDSESDFCSTTCFEEFDSQINQEQLDTLDPVSFYHYIPKEEIQNES